MTVATTSTHPNQEVPARVRRVLLVEDEPTLRRVIARNLISRGLDVDEAGTAQEAVEMATSTHPDLMLLDINLPDQTGWDVLRELRRRSTEVPTIILSAVRVGSNRLAEFHPIAYLPKPFPIEALLRLVFQTQDTPALSSDEEV